MEKGFHVINSSNLMNTIDYLIKFTEKYHQKETIIEPHCCGAIFNDKL